MKSIATVILAVALFTGCLHTPPKTTYATPTVAAPDLAPVKNHIDQARAALNRAQQSSGKIGKDVVKLKTSLDRIDYKTSILLNGWSSPKDK